MAINDMEYRVALIKMLEDDQNPQVVKLVSEAEIRREAMQDIINYIDKDYTFQFYNSKEVL